MDQPSSDAAPRQADVVLFDVGGRLYGADAVDVVRVALLDQKAPIATRLGEPKSPARALVVRGPGGEWQVPIDRFVGIEPAPSGGLKRLPAFLRGIVEPALIGFLMQPSGIVLLIDLQALVSEPSAAGGGAGEPRAKAS